MSANPVGRFEALMRWLSDSGDITPMGARQVLAVVKDEFGIAPTVTPEMQWEPADMDFDRDAPRETYAHAMQVAGKHWATIRDKGITYAQGYCSCPDPINGPHNITSYRPTNTTDF